MREPHLIPCPECQGSGTEEHEEITDSGVYSLTFTDCTNCKGEGTIVPLDYEDERGDWLYHKRRDDEE